MDTTDSYDPEKCRYPTQWALGAIAQLLPSLPYEPEGGLPGTARPLGSWYRLCYHMNHQPQKSSLGVRLSYEQQVSFQILHEWWVAQYQDVWLGDVDTTLIDLEAGSDREDSAKVRRFLTEYLRLDSATRGTESAREDINHGLYYKTMYELIDFEFSHDSCYDPWNETSEMLDGRRTTRIESAKYAYCQAAGWRIYQQHQNLLTKGQSWKANAPVLKTAEHVDWTFLDEPSNAFLARGPVLCPCPWLGENYDDLGNLPYFLWDMRHGCTVMTADLDFRPQYVAISHTWGRWVISHPIPVEGVPWKVPQNSCFNVAELARILSCVPGGLDFVWFDLVCIPQDGSDRGAKEIARQAQIFRGARYAIAWLNSIESLDGLFSGMAWKALQFLKFGTGDGKQRLDIAVRSAWDSFKAYGSGLYSPRPDGRNYKNWSLNPWFTSLWTLQEVCLRPDMWICVRDWSYLSSDGAVPVTMSGVVSMIELDATAPAGEDDTSYREFAIWRHRTGLLALLDLDQISIISLGDLRECSGRRAEAIMSVLGATTWYTDALQQSIASGKNVVEELERDLVLGKYPVQFANELALKMPGSFFAAFDKTIFLASSDVGMQIGSMLPFSRDRTAYTPTSPHRFLGYAAEPVISIKSWVVQKDGTVKIPQATVISSKTMHNEVLSRILPVQFFGRNVQVVTSPLPVDIESCTGVPYKKDEWNDLHRWIHRRPAESYAVLMQYHHRREQSKVVWTSLSGVILERVGSGPLSKVANFILYDEKQIIDFFISENVNWIVY